VAIAQAKKVQGGKSSKGKGKNDSSGLGGLLQGLIGN
jgi:hypothetical protein